MRRLNILHISDLHERAAFDGMPPARQAKLDWDAEERGYVLGQKFKKTLTAIAREGVDIVCFTGDLADWGRSEEYHAADARIREILSIVQVPNDRFFAVPGNHDVRRGIQSEAYQGIRAWHSDNRNGSRLGRWLRRVEETPIGLKEEWREQIHERTAEFWSWLEKFNRINPRPHLSRPLGYRITIPGNSFHQIDEPIHIVGLDSAWLCGGDDDQGRILVTEEQVQAHIRMGNRPLEGLRIGLIHHPLDHLADHHEVRRLLGDNGVDVLLHGHQHTPLSMTADEPGARLRLIAAGCLMEGDIGKGWPNGFQLISIAPGTKSGLIKFKKWSQIGRFWTTGTDLYRDAPDGTLHFEGHKQTTSDPDNFEHPIGEAPRKQPTLKPVLMLGDANKTSMAQRMARDVVATMHCVILAEFSQLIFASKPDGANSVFRFNIGNTPCSVAQEAKAVRQFNFSDSDLYLLSLAGFSDQDDRARPSDGGGRTPPLLAGAEVRKKPILLGPDAIVSILVQAAIICPSALALESARGIAPEYTIYPKPQAVVHKFGWFWAIMLYKQEDPHTYIMFIGSDGDRLSNRLSLVLFEDYIVEQDLTGLKPLEVPGLVDLHAVTIVKKRYLAYLAGEYGSIQLDGLPADDDVGTRELRLDKLFVPLHFLPIQATSKRGHGIDGGVDTAMMQKIMQILNVHMSNDRVIDSHSWEEFTHRMSLSVGAAGRMFTPRDVQRFLSNLSSDSKSGALFAQAQLSLDMRVQSGIGDLLLETPHLIVLAPPGAGKSTLIKWLITNYAQYREDDLVDAGLPISELVPLLVRCRELGDRFSQPLRKTLFQIAESADLEEHGDAFRTMVKDALKSGQALILLDGLDEIADESSRRVFVEKVRTFISSYPANYVVITSREPGYRSVVGILDDKCQKRTIAPLVDDDIRRLVLGWYKELLGDREAVARDANQLANEICSNDRISALSRNPLLLTTLLLVHRWLGQLPTKRSVLYEKAVEVLLRTWNVQAHKPLDPDEAVPQLAYIAYSMMTTRKQRLSDRELKLLLHEARRQMPDILAYTSTSVTDFIGRVELRSSLLVQVGYAEEGGSMQALYEFRHLTFQEYLAAVAAVDQHLPDDCHADSLAKVLAPHYADPWWKEVIPLAAVRANRREAPALINEIIEQLQNASEDGESEDGESEDGRDQVRDRLSDLLVQCLLDEIRISPQVVDAALAAIASKGIGTSVGALRALAAGRYGSAVRVAFARQFINDSVPDPERFEKLCLVAEFDDQDRAPREDLFKALVHRLKSGSQSHETLVLTLAQLTKRWPNATVVLTRPEGIDEGLRQIAGWGMSSVTYLRFAARLNWRDWAIFGVPMPEALTVLQETVALWMENLVTQGHHYEEFCDVVIALGAQFGPGELRAVGEHLQGLDEFLDHAVESASQVPRFAALALAHSLARRWTTDEIVSMLTLEMKDLSGLGHGEFSLGMRLIRQVLGTVNVVLPSIPVLTLRSNLIFPGVTRELLIARDHSISMIDQFRGGIILGLLQRDKSVDVPGVDDLYPMGVFLNVRNISGAKSDGTRSILVEGLHRGHVHEWHTDAPFMQVSAVPLFDKPEDFSLLLSSLDEIHALLPVGWAEGIVQSSGVDEFVRALHSGVDLCSDASNAARQAILEGDCLADRLRRMLGMIQLGSSRLDD